MDEVWFRFRVKNAKEKIASLTGHAEYVGGPGSTYAKKTAIYNLYGDFEDLTDFELMVMYDGNPCFGGNVSRFKQSDCTRATITVYTD